MWKFGTVDTTSPEPELDLTWLHTIFGMGGRPKRSLMPTRRSDRWPRSTAQLRLSWSIQKESPGVLLIPSRRPIRSRHRGTVNGLAELGAGRLAESDALDSIDWVAAWRGTGATAMDSFYGFNPAVR